jgi:hypothetical protein
MEEVKSTRSRRTALRSTGFEAEEANEAEENPIDIEDLLKEFQKNP